MRGLSRGIVLLALCVLSACATTANLKELRRVTPQGSPYAIALTQKYLAFSEAEAKRHDWQDSSYFAEKGLRAGYGHIVTLEEIEDWNVPEEMKPELAAARAKLTGLLSDELAHQLPEEAAEAVFAYDCWLEELEEQRSSHGVMHCQEQFYMAVEILEFALLEEEAAEAPPERINNTAYLVYFGFDKAKFDQAAQQVVQQVIDDVTAKPTEEVVIHGHTDTRGAAEYNLELSEKRALIVLEALITAGIPKEILSYFAFGETDPAVETGDGVAEPKNRRVEIFIN